MYIIRGDRINTHYCNTKELCDKVVEYIKSRHDVDLITEHLNDELVYFDPGGAVLMIPELNVFEKIGPVEVRIENIDMLVEAIERKKIEPGREFVRFNSFHSLICLSLEELEQAKQFIRNNRKELEEKMERAKTIIKDYWKK